MRKILLAVALATSSFLVPLASPAAANHANVGGHWNQPPLVVSSNPVSPWDSVIQDAAFYWQDVAFHRGYYPPLPSHDDAGAYDQCNPAQSSGQLTATLVGRISVCPVPLGDWRLDGANAGRAYVYPYNDGSKHIAGAVIYINSALTGASRQITMRHEWGHALGLAHYDDPGGHPATCDLMNAQACGYYANSYDTQAVEAWQPYFTGAYTWHNQH